MIKISVFKVFAWMFSVIIAVIVSVLIDMGLFFFQLVPQTLFASLIVTASEFTLAILIAETIFSLEEHFDG